MKAISIAAFSATTSVGASSATVQTPLDGASAALVGLLPVGRSLTSNATGLSEGRCRQDDGKSEEESRAGDVRGDGMAAEVADGGPDEHQADQEWIVDEHRVEFGQRVLDDVHDCLTVDRALATPIAATTAYEIDRTMSE